MLGTRDAIRTLVQANPGAKVTEDQVRWVLRRGLIPTLDRVAGRLVWTQDQVVELAHHLGLAPPAFDGNRRPITVT